MRTLTINVEVDDEADIDHDPNDESDTHQYLTEVAEAMTAAIIDTCHCFGMISVIDPETRICYGMEDGRR